MGFRVYGLGFSSRNLVREYDRLAVGRARRVAEHAAHGEAPARRAIGCVPPGEPAAYQVGPSSKAGVGRFEAMLGPCWVLLVG